MDKSTHICPFFRPRVPGGLVLRILGSKRRWFTSAKSHLADREESYCVERLKSTLNGLMTCSLPTAAYRYPSCRSREIRLNARGHAILGQRRKHTNGDSGIAAATGCHRPNRTRPLVLLKIPRPNSLEYQQFGGLAAFLSRITLVT